MVFNIILFVIIIIYDDHHQQQHKNKINLKGYVGKPQSKSSENVCTDMFELWGVEQTHSSVQEGTTRDNSRRQ